MKRSGVWIGAALAVVAVISLLFLSSRGPAGDPFDIRSTGPDGYKAMAILLREQGTVVVRSTATDAAEADWGPDDILLVPLPSIATATERAGFADAARSGATVVYGEPILDESDQSDESDATSFDTYRIDARTLADTPAEPVTPGRCDMAELAGLGPVDAAFVPAVEVRSSERSCYGDRELALVNGREYGDGRVVTLGSPYLWVNARLQPAKESGGQPLDNAATALRILTPGTAPRAASARVTVVDAHPSPGASVNGSQDPIELLPVPVQLAVAQLIAAFGLFVWWRARRLGGPVAERMPVEVAGSELVVAVGDLLRRKGNATRAAQTLRAETRRALGSRLGVEPGASVEALATVVAQRSGRAPDEVHAALADSHVPDSESLVRLARTLDALRQEVLDVPTPR